MNDAYDDGKRIRWGRECDWLADFGNTVAGETLGRALRVCTVYDLPYILRDGLAYFHLLQHLGRRRDVEWSFHPAWMSQSPAKTPGVDYLFVGRPRMFFGSTAGRYAHPLEGGAHAKFKETRDGAVGAELRYEGRPFVQLGSGKEAGGPQRDYAVLMCRRWSDGTELHRLVAIAGLGSLGTLAFALLLTDAALLADLVAQVKALLSKVAPGADVRFDDAFEICIRFDVQAADLEDFVNNPEFGFQVEVVVAGEDTFFHEQVPTLVLHGEGTSGCGSVTCERIDGAASGRVVLGDKRFPLLSRLATAPDGVAHQDLVEEFFLAPKRLSMVKRKGLKPASSRDILMAKGALRRAIFDLRRRLVPLVSYRPIEDERGRYVLRVAARLAD
jgi:hypothetical protein